MTLVHLLLNHLEVAFHLQILLWRKCFLHIFICFNATHQCIHVLTWSYKISTKKWPYKLRRIVVLYHVPSYTNEYMFKQHEINFISILYWLINTNMMEHNIFNKTGIIYFLTESEILQFTCMLQLLHSIHTPFRYLWSAYQNWIFNIENNFDIDWNRG